MPSIDTRSLVSDSTGQSALLRAVTLAERVLAPGRLLAQDAADRGLRRLHHWKAQRPFAAGPWFDRRLAGIGIDEAALRALLAAPAPDLAVRAGRTPAWMARLSASWDERQAMPAVRSYASIEARPEHGFLLAVAPLVSAAQKRLADGLAGLCRAHGWASIGHETTVAILGEEMVHAALNQLARTMVLELHVAKLAGGLRGATGAERFRSFVERYAEPPARAALFQEYPVLGRLVVSQLERAVRARLEMAARLCRDRAALAGVLGGPDAEDALLAVQTLGDPHRGGRSVERLTFRSGFDVIYKPRPLAADRHFQDLQAWLNARGWMPAFRTCRIVDRGTHGWMEFVRPEPCTSDAQVARHYERLGGYLALFYAIGGTDLHFENLIAAGEHPVVVDLETLFHPALVGPSPDLATASANTVVAESVLSVGLLPEQIRIGNASVDLSGLGAGDSQMSPDATPCWEEAGTDTMRLVRQRMLMPVGDHCPTLGAGAERARLQPHIPGFLDGFERMYRMLVASRDELLDAAGPLQAFAGSPTRVVLRPTHSYYLLHRESGHPNLLRDALDRDRHFDRLWQGVETDPALERVVACEHDDLWWGDIPVFTTRPASRDLWCSRGHRIAGYLQESGLEMVRRRLRRLGPVDLGRQLWLVRTALAAADPAAAPADGPPRPQRPFSTGYPLAGQTPVDHAARIGDRLLEEALVASGHATWLGEFGASGQRASIGPIGADLYAGLSGVALFLATLGRVTGDRRYAACAHMAVRTIRAQVTAGRGAAGIGGYAGWGSVVYALAHARVLLDLPALVADAESLVERLGDAIDADQQCDVVGGAAGCLLALLALHQVSGSAQTLKTATRCGDRLLAVAQGYGDGMGWVAPGTGPQALAGLSHGAAGIALALLKLSAATGEPRYRDAALKAWRYERSLFDAGAGEWRDLRPAAAGAPLFTTAWCHGAPGIGLARLASLDCVDDAGSRHDIDVAVHATLRQGFEMNHSLCHGSFGNLELPMTAARVLDRADWKSAGAAALARVARELTLHGPVCGSLAGLESPGLMTGLSGIGYGLLRLACPDSVPSILTLSPPLPAP
jgi:type 2 lantibiotic biosynthesis protein LanM